MISNSTPIEVGTASPALCPDGVSFWCPPFAESPFALSECYPSRDGVFHHLGWRYPALFAPMDSCADPNPSHCLWFSLGQQVFAGCCQSLLGEGSSRRYLCEPFPTCLDPCPGCSCGVFCPFLLTGHRPSLRYHKSAPGITPHSDFSAGSAFRGCSHSFIFRPAGLLATQVAPTTALLFACRPFGLLIFSPFPVECLTLPHLGHLVELGSRGVSFRAPHSLLPPCVPDMLAVRTGQLTAGDFHPIRSAALSAAPITARS